MNYRRTETSEFEEMKAAMLLSRLPGIGAAKFARLIDEYKSATAALEYWHGHESAENKTARSKSSTLDKIKKTLLQLESGKINGTYYSHYSYPRTLYDLNEPAPVIFYSGQPRTSWPKAVAVVGTRKADSDACVAVKRIVKRFKTQFDAVLSGGAFGIDTSAHEAALAENIETICVVANGLDIDYPKENANLFRQIEKKGGAIVTELLCGAKPYRSFFPTRNRLLAALAHTVIVVQAPEKSGALITANWAKKLGRRLLVLKPLNNGRMWQGNISLIENDAEALSL